MMALKVAPPAEWSAGLPPISSGSRPGGPMVKSSPAERLGDDLVREVVPIGTVLPERGDRRPDQSRVERPTARDRTGPTGRACRADRPRRSRPLRQQAPQDRLVRATRQVERDALLRGVQVERRRAALGMRGIPREWSQEAPGLALRGLDLDDARAQACQDLAAVGARISSLGSRTVMSPSAPGVAPRAGRVSSMEDGVDHRSIARPSQ